MDDLTQEFIAESLEGLDRMERCLTDLEVRPGDGELVAEIFRAVHTIKGTTGFLGFGRLEKLAHAGESLLGALRDGRIVVSESLINGLLRLRDGLRQILRLIEITGGEGIRATDEDGALIESLMELSCAAPGGDDAAVPRVVTKHAEIILPVATGHGLEAEFLAGQVDTSVSPAEVQAPSIDAGLNDKSLRIGVDVLNRMMNLVGDLVLTRNQLLQSSLTAANFPELARRLDGITADLRETVMQARMQPVGHLFNKFPRMVRDLARTCGREVRIEFLGVETGLDKSLLEAIKDPLTHAVRNAVDHGIEDPNERSAAGKPREGCVRLKAFHQSGFVVIEISDDGAGIEIARVLAKAVEKKLVTAEQAVTMTELETLQLIFVAGFSTAAEVTNISGRGVGMDVVRANVEKVGGSVEIESKAGVGTTLRLRVPLTLAIVPALVVSSCGQSFALPQNALAELVYVRECEAGQALERIGAAEFYRLRERLLPVVRLGKLLELAPMESAVVEGFYMAVLEAEGRRYGLVVEELLAPEEIVVKPLSNVLLDIGLFSGATVLGNGTIALILDVTAIAERAGVKAVERGDQEIDVLTVAHECSGDVPLLVFEDRDGERKALPLDVVERIETVPMEKIEYAGGRPMLQYRGNLLPLEDDCGVLEELRAKNGDDRNAGVVVTVLICGRNDDGVGYMGERRVSERRKGFSGAGKNGVRRSGRVVRRVLDVTVGTWLEDGSTEPGLDGMINGARLALVSERVTTVYRANDVDTGWTEVA